MPRRGNVPKREAAPDAIYGSVLVTKLINNVMLDGKKSLAEGIVYQALETVRDKMGKDPVEILDQALKNIMPVLEVRPRRVGGATYQVPVEVRPERRVSLGLRWLVRFARARGEKTTVEKLAGEIMDAANGTGGAVRRREETHRMAEANKAFAHYRW
ncbi:MAG: 30S ribosomal protein S7 [Firmicutes bacterium]|jgi:small subunit ribosomal protein S7|nr:30S ribosomal protein S7 [Bacillota bacterium]